MCCYNMLGTFAIIVELEVLRRNRHFHQVENGLDSIAELQRREEGVFCPRITNIILNVLLLIDLAEVVDLSSLDQLFR